MLIDSLALSSTNETDENNEFEEDEQQNDNIKTRKLEEKTKIMQKTSKNTRQDRVNTVDNSNQDQSQVVRKRRKRRRNDVDEECISEVVEQTRQIFIDEMVELDK